MYIGRGKAAPRGFGFVSAIYTVRIKKKGNPYSKAHCSKVNRFENLPVAYPLVPFLHQVCHV